MEGERRRKKKREEEEEEEEDEEEEEEEEEDRPYSRLSESISARNHLLPFVRGQTCVLIGK